MLDIVLTALVSALIGGAGFTGLLIYYLKRYIDNKLYTEEAASKQCLDYKSRKAIIDREMQKAQGRMFYWIFDAIRTNHTSVDELEVAYICFKNAESKKDELEQEIILDYEQKQGRRK